MALFIVAVELNGPGSDPGCGPGARAGTASPGSRTRRFGELADAECALDALNNSDGDAAALRDATAHADFLVSRGDAPVADLDRQGYAGVADAPGGDDAHRPVPVERCGSRCGVGGDESEGGECAQGAGLDELQQGDVPLLFSACEAPCSNLANPCRRFGSRAQRKNQRFETENLCAVSRPIEAT
jgi:hypothetical protein